MSAKRNRRRRTRRMLLFSLSVIVSLLVCGLGAAWWALSIPQADVVRGEPVAFVVESGASTRAIARDLAEAGVIANANMFRVRTRLAGADGELKPGTYELSTGMTYAAAIAALRRGPKLDWVSVTIPEGFTVDRIAARVESETGIPSAEFLALAKGGAGKFVEDHPRLKGAYEGSVEGYLFPKTYRVDSGATAADVIESMLDQFDAETSDLVASDELKARGIGVPELVTVASIVEREARLDSERPLVASVIYNRLAIGMKLEIDATVEYVLPGDTFRLRYSDLKVDSPYNTYRYAGLPPGPIASPGMDSLRAAAQPAQTRYIYYVLTGKDGSHTFTTNKTDFLKAKARSKEVFGR